MKEVTGWPPAHHSVRGACMNIDTIERPQSLTEIAADRLRPAIVEGAFRMGQPLSENMLSKLFNISKTPIKHALNELRNEGLVVIIPQKGSYVFTITPEDLRQLTELREALEIKGLYCAFERNREELIKKLSDIYGSMLKTRETDNTIEYLRLDSLYHQTIIDLSENDYLLSAHKLIAVKTRATLFHLSNTPLQRKEHFEEHGEILKSLKAGSADTAVETLKTHLYRHSHIDFSRLEDFGTRNETILSY